MLLPKEFSHLVSAEERTELLSKWEAKDTTSLICKFNAACRIEAMNDRYLKAKTSDCTELEMRLMKPENKDSVICIIETYMPGKGESRIHFLSTFWQETKPLTLPDLNDMSLIKSRFFMKPETMSDNEFQRRLSIVDAAMIEAHLSPDNDTITLSAFVPMLSNDERKQISEILHNITLTL